MVKATFNSDNIINVSTVSILYSALLADCQSGYCIPQDQDPEFGCKVALQGEWGPGGSVYDPVSRCRTCPTGSTTSGQRSNGKDDCNGKLEWTY
jgi:hypothetical protein